MDRFSGMLAFVKVVENGGFSAAARQLETSPSIVTTHVKALEDRLGVRLLNRTTRNVSLTEAGTAYYERCVQILCEIEDADETVHVLQSRPQGTLRLNVSPAVPLLLAPAIAEFAALYPDVSVRLTMTSRMIDLVEEGFDLAIRFKTIADSNLITRRLAAWPLVICGSPDYLAKRGRPEHPSDLVRHNCLVYYDASWGRGGKDWHFTGPDGDLAVRVSGSFETNSINALRTAILLGQGLTVLPSAIVAEELRSGALIPLLTEFISEEFPLDAFYPHREHLPAKVRTFIDVAAKNLRDATRNGTLQPDHDAVATT